MQRVVRFAGALVLLLLSCTPADRVGPTPSTDGTLPDIARSGGAIPTIRFSEIHYDNTGTDAGEAIEVSGPAGMSIAGWQVVLYNGNGGASYNTQTLSGILPATCGDRGVVVLNYPVNGIQNGDPDGLALVDAGGTVIEFLSYEGIFAATNGPAVGMTSTDIGVREAGTEALGLSLQRNGSNVWSAPAASTFGSCNDNDVTPPPPTVVSVTVAPAAATIVQGGAQTFTATALDAASQPIAGVVFTWSSSAVAIATVNANGLATGVAPGDADIVATAPNGVADTATLHVDAPPPPPTSDVRFSELHYDNTGVDIGESIEVEGPAGADLTGWSVVLYNGSDGAAYNTTLLSGTIPPTCGARGVVVVSYPSNGIQNGSPDGLALVDAGGQVIEFLSYEGTLTASNGPASGTVSTDIGAAEESSSPIGQSLQRDAANVWTLQTASFGACNGDTPPPPPSTITFTGRVPTDPPLPVGFEDQLFAALHDGTGATVPTTITWTAETPALASIDQNGVMRALGAGTAVFRATAGDGTTATFSLPTRIAVASTTAQYAGNAAFGEPSDADPSDDFIIRHDQYTSSFSQTRATPNWVSYEIDPTHFGPEDRCDCFTFDPALPAEFSRYTTADYTGAGAIAGFGIDRGHLARSFDRTSASLDNAYTFYFSNIVPQAADLNQGPWANLENDLGNFARNQNREVYIIAGVAGNSGTVKNEGKIVIPTFTWKVALVLPHDQGLADVHQPQDILAVIAVIMPNQPGIRNVPWQTYTKTVDEVEALSGYDLLASLPDWIERIVEANDHFPTVAAPAAFAGIEGSAIPFQALASDPDAGDVLTYAWTFGDGSAGTGPAPAHAYADNGTYAARVIVTDLFGAADTASAVVTVANAPPVITSLTTPADPSAVGAAVTLGLTFTDAGSADTHTVTVDWGDGSSDASLTHAYAAAEFYNVSVTVRDDDGAADTRAATAAIVIYNPTGSFVTGGGWFNAAGDKANFGLEARYGPTGAARGNLELHVNARDFRFSSEVITYLVVTGDRATLRGTGTLASGEVVQFLFVAQQGAVQGVRLKVWRAGGSVVFDNQPGAPETGGAVSGLGGGSIKIH